MASQHFSGAGDPNGVVVADPGDIYQDQTGAFWIKTIGPGTSIGWIRLRGASAMALPALWRQDDLPAGTTAQVPIVGSNFSDLLMIRDGSLVGIRARLTQGVINGDLDVAATVNGVPVGLTVNITGGDDTAFNTTGIGTVPYVQGDQVGVQFTTSGDFGPANVIDLEVWLEAVEVIA